ncbi:hypothetical protein ACQ4PT_049924 [Festuca glaucescens]
MEKNSKERRMITYLRESMLSVHHGAEACQDKLPPPGSSQRLLGVAPADEDVPPADGSTPHPMPVVLSSSSKPLLKGIMSGHNGSMFLLLSNRAANDFNLNDMPAHGMPDLNALPHQLNAEDFLELNDLINPVHQGAVNMQDVEMQDLQALVNPVIQNAHVNANLNEEQAADNQSELTLTISSDPSSASGSVAGAVNQPAFHQNLHIGMVLIQDQIQHMPHREMERSLDAHVQDSFLFSKEGTTAWASFFKPTTVVAHAITVPAQWADFFTAKLLSPEDFDWAKSLMQSKIWQILSEFDSQQNDSTRDFVLPLHCPASAPPLCSLSKACSDATQGFSTPQAIKPRILLAPPASTSVVHIRKKAKDTPLCVSEKAVVKNLCNKFSIAVPDSEDDSPPEGPTSRQTRSTKEKNKFTKKEANDEASKAKKKEVEGDSCRMITYSRESLLSFRRAASETYLDSKLLAGIDACKNEVAAEFMGDSSEPRVLERPQASAGSTSKICTRFFSTGCRFGDGCRFLHHLPGSGHEQAAVVKKMDNLNLGLGDPAPARAAPATVKTRLCKNRDKPEGCKWGDRCHFAHSKGELGKPMGPGSSYKTKLCVSFVTGGSCSFSGKCHFAHGEDELRSSDAPQRVLSNIMKLQSSDHLAVSVSELMP